ncbi:High-affinity potassium transport protein [Dirofilaria immitis]
MNLVEDMGKLSHHFQRQINNNGGWIDIDSCCIILYSISPKLTEWREILDISLDEARRNCRIKHYRVLHSDKV